MAITPGQFTGFLNLLRGRGAQAVSRVLPTNKERVLQQLEESAPAFFAPERAAGATFNPRAGSFLEAGVDRGQMMGSVLNTPQNLVRTPEELLAFAQRPDIMPRLQRGEYLGTWRDAERGGLVADPSRRFATRAGALAQGLRTQQKAGFDLGRIEEFPVSRGAFGQAISPLIGSAVGGATGAGVAAENDQNPFLGALLGAAGGAVVGRGLGRALSAGGNRGAISPELLTGGLAGVAAATRGSSAVNMPLRSLLSRVVTTGEGSTAPSPLATKIVEKLKSGVTTKQVERAGKTRNVDELVFGADSKSKYPTELSELGLQPIMGYNYASKGSDILKLDESSTIQVLKNNIRSLAGQGGAREFYSDVNTALRATTGGKLPSEQLGGAFAPFSMGTAVPRNAVQARRFIENPELFPGRFPGEGTLAAGGAWRQGIRSAVNENPLDPRNFNVAGNVIKVGSFAENTAMPATSTRVTVDRHAVQAALGIRPVSDDVIPDLGNEKVYRLFERAYQEVADELGVLPSQLQSEVWDVWRRLMVKNPGASSPTEFFLPTNPSGFWSLTPQKRASFLRDALSKAGKDEQFMLEAGLL
jgi:hypothetical protein